MTTPTAADLLALLRRAEAREREAVVESGASTLGDLFEADRERHLSQMFGGGNATAERDALRSEADRVRHNELLLAAQLRDLTEAEAAEVADLASRRSGSYYRRPAEEEK